MDGHVLESDPHARRGSGFVTWQVVTIAAAILRDAEVGIDSYKQFNYIRNFTPKPMSTLEVCAA